MILQVAQTLQVQVSDLNVSVHDKPLDYESRGTLKDHSIVNKTTVQCGLPKVVMYGDAGHSSLYSHCEDCGMNKCPFEDLIRTWPWDICELSKKHENAYLILCQAFSLPSDVIKIIMRIME